MSDFPGIYPARKIYILEEHIDQAMLERATVIVQAIVNRYGNHYTPVLQRVLLEVVENRLVSYQNNALQKVPEELE